MEWADWARAGFGLAATLALLLGAAVIARRLGVIAPRAGVSERRLRVVESLLLDPRRRLVVVRFDSEDHLLLLSAAGDRIVARTPAPKEAPASAQTEAAT
jgi:flagellar protein FliO/FliZ